MERLYNIYVKGEFIKRELFDSLEEAEEEAFECASDRWTGITYSDFLDSQPEDMYEDDIIDAHHLLIKTIMKPVASPIRGTYEIIPPKEKIQPYFEVIITGDMNDGDYLTETSIFSKKEFNGNNIVAELLTLINEPKRGQYLVQEVSVPFDGQEYTHTIISVEVFYYNEDSIKHEVKLTEVL